MIADKDTDYVYLSDRLRTISDFVSTCKTIIYTLDKHNIKYEFLKGTKDIWARDYMPIQVNSKKNVEYRYDPDYLQAKKYRKSKSHPDLVCYLNNIKTQKTDLIIDGGNVIKSKESVIMTDKVISENKENYNREVVIAKLEDLFETDKIALIPWDKENDEFGHADGMVRFINNNTVLLQSYFDDYSDKFKGQLYSELDRIGLTWEKMQFLVKEQDERNWAYMNFLQTKDLILLPKFGIDEDIQAMEQIKKYYPDYSSEQIENVDMSKIVEEGGALNCITWTIRQ